MTRSAGCWSAWSRRPACRSLPRPSHSAATLTVTVDGPGESIQGPDENEAYTLEVTPSGAHLKAPTVVGAIHGLETFLQLVQNNGTNDFLPAVSIDDSPRFPWRGLMIDVGRHFMPVDVIKRNLDGMAAVKLNVFHWHLSDDQGFRIESKTFRSCTEWAPTGTTTRRSRLARSSPTRATAASASFRNSTCPATPQSWFVGYPELASGPGPYQIERQWGVFDPAMDPTRDSTYTFLDGFIGEMAALFPDAYFHIGGDEVNGEAVERQSRAFRNSRRTHDLKDNAALQTYFNRAVADSEEAWQEDDRLGRNVQPRSAERRRDPIVARI